MYLARRDVYFKMIDYVSLTKHSFIRQLVGFLKLFKTKVSSKFRFEINFESYPLMRKIVMCLIAKKDAHFKLLLSILESATTKASVRRGNSEIPSSLE